MSRFLPVQCMADLEGLIRYTGFLPLFTCSIPGFSVEENVNPAVWFKPDTEGPWEWRSMIAQKKDIFYGKFAENKAVFVHRDWFGALCNYRRNGYDFDTRYELGMATRRDNAIIELLSEEGSMLSTTLRGRAGFGKGGYKNFEPTMTDLQLQTYVCIQSFDKRLNKQGQPYGWDVTRYTRPEHLLPPDYMDAAYAEDPAASFDRMVSHLTAILPDISREAIARWLK